MDLTVGSPLKRILIFMLPMILGNFVQQLYSLVDSVIVGQAIGADALTGVGSTGSFSFMVLGFVSGLAQGFSVLISQRRGANDDDGMRKSFATGIVLMTAIVAVLTVAALFATKPMLVAMNTQEAFLPYAVEYITVIFGGMLLSGLSNLFGATLRAIGDSRVPLYLLIISCFLNAGMDCLFVMALGMGVQGAAIATVLANGITAVLTFIYLWWRYPVLRFKPSHFKPNARNYGVHLRLGIPMALQMSIISIGMIFGQIALNTMEKTAVTAYVAATKIDGIATSIINNSAAAVSVFVGQNYGAKRYDRIKTGVKQFILFSLCLCAGMCGIVLALHRPLVMLFISRADRTEKLFSYAFKYLVFNASFYVLLSTLCISRSSLQGMGRGTLTLFSAAAEVGIRVAVSMLAIRFASFDIVCLLNCSSWMIANCFLIPSFLVVLNKYIKLFRKTKPATAETLSPDSTDIPPEQPQITADTTETTQTQIDEPLSPNEQTNEE